MKWAVGTMSQLSCAAWNVLLFGPQRDRSGKPQYQLRDPEMASACVTTSLLNSSTALYSMLPTSLVLPNMLFAAAWFISVATSPPQRLEKVTSGFALLISVMCVDMSLAPRSGYPSWTTSTPPGTSLFMASLKNFHSSFPNE